MAEFTRLKKPVLVVIGMSGNALDALATLQAGFEIGAFLDDNAAMHGQFFQGIPILPISALSDFGTAQVVCLIGSERSFRKREEIVARLDLRDERFATILDPSARVSPLCTLGPGVVVFPGVVITSNAVIGRHVLLLPQTVVHHDVSVGDFTLVGSRVVIAGGVKVGKSCYIGSGSSIRNGVEIGEGSLVGMAANVLMDVLPKSTVVGNPARVLRRGP